MIDIQSHIISKGYVDPPGRYSLCKKYPSPILPLGKNYPVQMEKGNKCQVVLSLDYFFPFNNNELGDL